MTILSGLHGRVLMRRAALSRLRLLVLLVLVPIGLRALEADVFFFVRVATAGGYVNAAAHWIYELRDVIACAGYIVAGITFDRLGLKRGFALVILAWCALVPLATIVDPYAYRALSVVFTAMLPGFVITAFLLAARLASPLRRRGLVITALLITYEQVYSRGLLHLRFAYGHRDIPQTWQFPILALATLGTVLFVVWLYGLREVDRTTGLDLRPPPLQRNAWHDILSDRAVWTILAIELCRGIVWHFSQGLTWDLAPLRPDTPAAASSSVTWATPAADLGAAWASDRVYRQRRDWVAARRPFIVAAFAVAGMAPLLGALATQSGPALHIVDILALGAFQIISLVFLDCMPRRLAGRGIGLVLSGEAVGEYYLHPLLDLLGRAFQSVIPLIILFAVVGAVLAARLLPRLRPADP